MVTAAKTTSQIAMHMSVAFGITFAFTGSLVMGGAAAVLEPIVNVMLLPLHDKMWERIRRKVEARQARQAALKQRRLPACRQADSLALASRSSSRCA